MGNGKSNSSSEGHRIKSLPSRGSYIDLELLIFVKKFELYLVTQYLSVLEATPCNCMQKKYPTVKKYLHRNIFRS
jgi:hypothetical protein